MTLLEVRNQSVPLKAVSQHSVVEAGHSESLTELRSDMHWWFSRSNYRGKMALLVKFLRLNRMILIWEVGRRTTFSARRCSYTTVRLLVLF